MLFMVYICYYVKGPNKFQNVVIESNGKKIVTMFVLIKLVTCMLLAKSKNRSRGLTSSIYIRARCFL
jgi:hypothetical protein